MNDKTVIGEQKVIHGDSCANCKFFKVVSITDITRGECRKNTPTAFLANGPNGQPIVLAAFPSISNNAWCGEHNSRTIQ